MSTKTPFLMKRARRKRNDLQLNQFYLRSAMGLCCVLCLIYLLLFWGLLCGRIGVLQGRKNIQIFRRGTLHSVVSTVGFYGTWRFSDFDVNFHESKEDPFWQWKVVFGGKAYPFTQKYKPIWKKFGELFVVHSLKGFKVFSGRAAEIVYFATRRPCWSS